MNYHTAQAHNFSEHIHKIVKQYMKNIFHSELKWANSYNSAESFYSNFPQNLSVFMENIIFIPSKRCNPFKYYVNTLIIVCKTCQKKEEERILVNYLIYAACCDLNRTKNCFFQFCFCCAKVRVTNFNLAKKRKS